MIEQGTQPLPETLLVVNPAWRRLDQSVRRERARLYRLRAEFGARTLPPKVEGFERRGGELREKIQAQELQLSQLKEKRRHTPAKLTLKELPETERSPNFARPT